MSYRSKRTRAQISKDDESVSKDDESVVSKKVTFPIASSLSEKACSNVSTMRWGPFVPPIDQPPNLQAAHPSTIKASLLKNKVTKPIHAITTTSKPEIFHPKPDTSLIRRNPPHHYPENKNSLHLSALKASFPKTQTGKTNIVHTFPAANAPDKTSIPQSQSHSESAPIWKNPSTSKQTSSFMGRQKATVPTSSNFLEKNDQGSRSLNTETLQNNQKLKQVSIDTFTDNVETYPKVENVLSTNQGKAFDLESGRENGLARSKSFIPKRHGSIPIWPDDVKFDEKEDVLAIDAEGKYQTISESIQPHDVWHANGIKYIVSFNEFYQPLKRGGHILVRFIGNVAKTERFCPMREINWHHVSAQFKVDIIKLIRAHFVIPDGDYYDQGILKRTGKSVRQYRHYLKKELFKPATKTKEQIYKCAPFGHPLNSWICLVDYWYSDKGKRFAECGKEARSSQNHVHTTGSTSYANIRADFEEKNEREPSVLEIFEQTHKRKDGTFVKDTITEDFLVDAQANVSTYMDFNPSSTKSRVEIENEAFNKLMYGDDAPKRPVGYGYGVKQADISGVRGILRKERFNSAENNTLALKHMEKVVADLTEQNKELLKQQDETNNMVKTMMVQFGPILNALSTGIGCAKTLDLAKTVLNTTNSKVSDSSNGRASAE